jgi:PleD family two-component response regulator
MALSDGEHCSIETLIHDADAAMYEDKAAKRRAADLR